MKKYLKVECPICGNVSQGSGAGNMKQGCEHFERVNDIEGTVVFANELGEKQVVDISSVGDRCIAFECPICNEKLDACTRGDAGEYKIEGKCTHFLELSKGKEDKLIAGFSDDDGNTIKIPVE